MCPKAMIGHCSVSAHNQSGVFATDFGVNSPTSISMTFNMERRDSILLAYVVAVIISNRLLKLMIDLALARACHCFHCLLLNKAIPFNGRTVPHVSKFLPVISHASWKRHFSSLTSGQNLKAWSTILNTSSDCQWGFRWQNLVRGVAMRTTILYRVGL